MNFSSGCHLYGSLADSRNSRSFGSADETRKRSGMKPLYPSYTGAQTFAHSRNKLTEQARLPLGVDGVSAALCSGLGIIFYYCCEGTKTILPNTYRVSRDRGNVLNLKTYGYRSRTVVNRICGLEITGT